MNQKTKPLLAAIAWVLLFNLTPSISHGGGVTVITHGWQPLGDGGFNDKWPINWVEAMSVAIFHRAAVNGGVASIWDYDPTIQKFVLKGGCPPSSVGASGDIILRFNWANESDDSGGGYAEAAGEALFVALMRSSYYGADGIEHNFVAQPLHFIGHSRGAVVNSEAVRRLYALGINVDHVTTLDPHPAQGWYEDPRVGVNTWGNVFYADNYWRADLLNPLDFNGDSVEGANNYKLSELILGAEGVGSEFEHSDVHSWYYGTIDLAADAFDGDFTVPAEFYGGGNPTRELNGYLRSRIGGEVRVDGGLITASAPRQPLAPQDWVVNGDFEYSNTGQLSDVAGYGRHGGSSDFIHYDDGLARYARMGGRYSSLVHNAVYVPRMSGTARLRFSARFEGVPGNEALMVSGFGATFVDGHLPVSESTEWSNYEIDLSAFEGQAGILRFDLVSASLVDIDDIRIEGGSELQWPNIRLTSLSPRFCKSGDPIGVSWELSFGQTTANAIVDFILDTDGNPYNGHISVLAEGVSVASGGTSITVPSVEPGQYHLHARIRVGDLFRYDTPVWPITVYGNEPGLPVISEHPHSDVIENGSDLMLTVQAASSTGLSYQWRRNGQAIPGAVGTTCLISSAAPHDSGAYDVVVQNTTGFVVSMPAVIEVPGARLSKWVGDWASDWEAATNWSSLSVPTAADYLMVNCISIQVSAAAQFRSMELLGGTLTGDFRCDGALNWIGGALSNSRLNVGPRGQLVLDGESEKTLWFSKIENEGELTWGGGGDWRHGAGPCVISNLSVGRFAITGNGIAIDDAVGGLTIVNDGLISKEGAAVTTLLDNVEIMNRGSVKVEAGTLKFVGNFGSIVTTNGSFATSPGAAVQWALFSGDQMDLFGSFDGGLYELLSGNVWGEFTINGQMNMTGGRLTLADLTIADGGRLAVSGDGRKEMWSSLIRNEGMLQWSGTGHWEHGGNGTTISNLAGATILLEADATAVDYAVTGLTIQNNGDIRKTGIGVTTLLDNVDILNQGSVEVEAGTLKFVGNFGSIVTTNGSFTTLSGAAVQWALFSGDQMDLFGSFDGGLYELLSGNAWGKFAINGEMNWSGGNLYGTSLTIGAAGQMNITGTSLRTLNGVLIDNHGELRWDGSGWLELPLRSSSVISNAVDGLFVIAGDAGVFDNGSHGLTINNAGILRKQNTSGTNSMQDTYLVNTGQLELCSGAVDFKYGVISSGVISVCVHGPSAGPDHGLILTSGNAELAGTLRVVWQNEYTPAFGDSITVMKYGARQGTFQSMTGLTTNEGISLSPRYDLNLLSLVAGTPTGNETLDSFDLIAASGSGFHLRLITDPGRTYTLQATEDFQSWLTLATSNALGSSVLFIDTEGEGAPHRFYRAMRLH